MKKSLWDLCDTIRKTNTCIMGVPEEGKKVAEMMPEIFPNREREMEIQIHEAQRFRNSITPKSPHRHIIIKLLKVNNKRRSLKVARAKQLITCEGIPVRLSQWISWQKGCRPGESGMIYSKS